MTTIGDRIRDRRTALGMTQAELGQQIGVNFRTISDLETGATSAEDVHLKALAKALGVGEQDLAPVLLKGEGVDVTRSVRLITDNCDPCFYCGMVADTVDHVTPKQALEWREHQHDLVWPKRKIVPACQECNSILGAKYFRTLARRKKFVKERLRRKYWKYVRLPEWTDRELAHLSGMLQRTVMDHQGAREVALARLAW